MSISLSDLSLAGLVGGFAILWLAGRVWMVINPWDSASGDTVLGNLLETLVKGFLFLFSAAVLGFVAAILGAVVLRLGRFLEWV